MSMQRTMWKYPLCPRTAVYVMPKGAEIKSCGYVEGDVVVWALVTPPTNYLPGAMIERRITCAMTGEMVDQAELGRFIGTVVCPAGVVVHVYEGLEVP